jgi:hypothetical protein
MAGDDVQFAVSAAVSPGNDCVPAAFKLATGEILAAFSQGDASLAHLAFGEARTLPVGFD